MALCQHSRCDRLPIATTHVPWQSTNSTCTNGGVLIDAVSKYQHAFARCYMSDCSRLTSHHSPSLTGHQPLMERGPPKAKTTPNTPTAVPNEMASQSVPYMQQHRCTVSCAQNPTSEKHVTNRRIGQEEKRASMRSALAAQPQRQRQHGVACQPKRQIIHQGIGGVVLETGGHIWCNVMEQLIRVKAGLERRRGECCCNILRKECWLVILLCWWHLHTVGEAYSSTGLKPAGARRPKYKSTPLTKRPATTRMLHGQDQ